MQENNSETLNRKETDLFYNYTAEIPQLEEENKFLKDTVRSLKEELEKFKKAPQLVCEVKELYDDKAVIRVPNGNEFLVNVSFECKELRAGDYVFAEQKNLTILKKAAVSKKFNVEKFVIVEKPTVQWNEIGGLDREIEEIKEVIELPLKQPELFEKIGINPPKGILLYGSAGTGKTLLAKAVANSTHSTFIEIVGSELVQKYIGEGAKLVREIFEYAKEKSPSIIFIDELDSIAAIRVDIGTSGEREVQRTFMQLLAEIDGFKHLGNVKVIGCTNRIDIVDPAVLRPGRLDRLIKIPIPNKEGRAEIFSIHTKNMNTKDVDIDEVVNECENFSGAEIRAVCTEAGYFAIRDKRLHVTQDDFRKAVAKVRNEEQKEGKEYLKMFG